MKDVKELKNELKNYLENRNCKEHNRLIVATLNVDSDNKKMYCIDCIKEIEQQFNDNKTELVMVKSATKSMRVQLDKLERWITTHTKYDIIYADPPWSYSKYSNSKKNISPKVRVTPYPPKIKK